MIAASDTEVCVGCLHSWVARVRDRKRKPWMGRRQGVRGKDSEPLR